VTEADEGWDFSWLEGRATGQRPSWVYQRLMIQRLASASTTLDIGTGDGEALAGLRALSSDSGLIAEVNRATFANMTPALDDICRFVPFSALREHAEQVGPFIQYLIPDSIQAIAESCEAG
jgi:hypothetical protein